MMREIHFDQIVETVRDLCIRANCVLPEDLQRAISRSLEKEQSTSGQAILKDLMCNYTYAQEKMLPICQDTGMAVVFIELGQEVHITGGLLADAVNEGVAQGYTEGFLRKSVVADPIRRCNTNNNTPAILHLTMVAGEQMKITVAPKGFGSENMTVLRMLKPSATVEDIEAAVVEAVAAAGSNPCPPLVVGVGLGGDAELSATLAKRALLRPVDQRSADPFYAELEVRLLKRINALGIGPQGLGGTTTALTVAIEPWPTHIAGLPCCVSLGCHATRHASAVL